MKYEIEFYKIDVENEEFVFLGSTTSYKSLTFANRLNDIGAASFSLNSVKIESIPPAREKSQYRCA